MKSLPKSINRLQYSWKIKNEMHNIKMLYLSYCSKENSQQKEEDGLLVKSLQKLSMPDDKEIFTSIAYNIVFEVLASTIIPHHPKK